MDYQKAFDTIPHRRLIGTAWNKKPNNKLDKKFFKPQKTKSADKRKQQLHHTI